jgi:topoisomerase-4 subunit B
MPGLVQDGRLYLAMPPLYRLTQGSTTVYARDDAHREEIVKKVLKGRGKIEVSRFKGLGEMPPAQLKETTMNPATRTLLQVQLPDSEEKDRVRDTARLVEGLMGRKPEKRFQYIQENAQFVRDLDV